MNHRAFLGRFRALLRKELRQMWRDKSNLAVGVLLPVALILLFGYGLSLDVKNAPIAVVLEDSSPAALDLLAALNGSAYLSPVRMATLETAEKRLRDGAVDGIVQVPGNFSRRLAQGDAQVQLIVNGVDSTTASTVAGYVEGALETRALQRMDRAGDKPPGSGAVEVIQRMWFNEAGISTWYLVPGLVVLILTLIGAFLSSLLIAREWERGTLESLFVTPVRPLEIVLAKLVPYLLVGIIDFILCLLAARFLFAVPIRGSLPVIAVASMLYLTVSLLVGLFISGLTRNQFQASQVALLTSFLPAMMLSGFVFDLRNVPAAIRVISQLLPATHFMGLIKTLFLAGNNWPMILRDCGVLTLYALILLYATYRTLRKTLDR